MAEQKNEQKSNPVAEASVDQVLAVSRHADGSPAQTPGFKSVAPEATADLSERQLREQAASAVDYLHRREQAEASEGSSEPDEPTKKLKAAQERAADSAAGKVEKL